MSALRVKQEPPTSSSGGAGASVGYRYHQHQHVADRSHHQVPATCFVCGAPGTDYRLHTRPRDKGSYFPFLESHEVIEGAQRPGPDGVVAACVVCYSFLTQQWEAFERSRTPLAKRLYWLKRNDASADAYHHHHSQGDFTPTKSSAPVTPNISQRRADGGSRMSSRHDEDIRGGPGSNCLAPSGSLVDDESRDSMSSLPVLDLRNSREADRRHRSQQQHQQQQQQHSRSSGSGRSSRGENAVAREYHDTLAPAGAAPAANGALDLSMPDKNAATEVCYLCGTEAPKGTLMNIYAKPIANCPFFPSLTLHPRASGSRPMDPSGRVQACGACHQHLLQQWDGFQRLNVHHSERHYRLRKSAKVPSSQRPPTLSQSSPSPFPSSSKFLCFLCGVETSTSQQRQLLSACHPNHPEEPYFPFLEKMRPPKGVPPLPSSGRALVCPTCHCAVLAQHQQLGSNRPQPTGFSLPCTAPTIPQVPNGIPARERDGTDDYDSCNCYTCGVLCPMSHTVSLASVPTAGCAMFFPFLRDISPPVGVRPVDDAGRALVCRACASSLRHQWEAFECEHVPHSHRRYVLYAQPPAGPETQLRIEVPEDTNPRGVPQASLLTTVTSSRVETPPQQQQQHHQHQGASSSSSSTSAALDLSGGRGGGGISVPTAIVCYVCGARTLADDTYTVRSYPKHGDEGSAFFPFLTLHAAPSGAEPMTEDGTVLVCIFCYHTLMSQWSAPETSHRNPWTRAYDFHDYVCYVCGVTTYRKRVKAITVLDFPFLVEHPRPADALVLREGASVAVCLMCYETLNAQWSDFERMKVPLELRKYNWIAAPPPPEVDDDADRQRGQQQLQSYHHRPHQQAQHQLQSQRTFSRSSRPSPSAHSPVNGETSSDRQSVVVTDEECDQQPHSRGMVPAPSKAPLHHQPPQGLGLLPVVPKVCRSSSQISPESSVINHHGHGHHQHPYNHQQQQQHSARNASFAAALRKLAIKQATDPVSDHDAPCASPAPVTPCPSQQPSKRSSGPSQPPPPLLVSGPITTAADPSPYKGGERNNREHGERDLDRDRDADEATRESLKYLPYQSQSQREREEQHAHYPHLRGSSRHEEHTQPATGFQPYRSSSGSGSQGQQPIDGHLHHRHQQHQHPVHHPHVRSHSHSLNHHHQNSLTHPAHRHPTAMTPGGYDHVAHAAATAAAAAAAAAAATYPYQPTFLTTAHLPPPHTFRLVEPMYLERYGHLLRPPHMLHVPPAQHPSAGLLPPHFAYAQELMASQPVGLVSPADAAALAHERVKIEEQQRRDRERERMLSPQHQMAHHHHHVQHDQQQSQHHSDRRGSIVHGTPRDATQKSPSNSRLSAELETGSYSNSNSNHYHQHRSHPSSPQQHRQHASREGATSPWQHPRVPPHRQSADDIPPEVRHFWDIPATSCGFNRTTPVPTTTADSALPNPPFTPASSPSSSFPGDAIIVSADDPCSPAFGRLSKMTHGGVGSHRGPPGLLGANHAPPTASPPPLLKTKLEPSRSPEENVRVGGLEQDSGLVSKLDTEERRRREKRAVARAKRESEGLDGEEDVTKADEDEEDEDEDDDSESEDERTWAHLVTVYSGPPLPLNESQTKLRFLGHLGLTSHKRRRELQLERLLVRRRRFRERSLSPIPVVSSPPSPETLAATKHSSLDPAQHDTQDFRQKTEFLNRLGLEPVLAARRQDLEAIWSAIVDERRRRNGFRSQGEKRKLHVKASEPLVVKTCKRISVGITDSIMLRSKRSAPDVKNGETIPRQVPRLLQSQSLLSSKKADKSNCSEVAFLTESEHNDVSSDNRLCGDDNHSYRWPGIEVLMEAYERYRQEHQLEREVLMEQCGRLRNRHGELSGVAERLSRQMADLIRTKKEQDEERQRRQCAIDHLKRCLKTMR